jgi:hypothetical protein
MNAERLHAVAIAIRDDIQTTNALRLLQQLRDSLQNQVNQPGQPTYQQQVSQFLQELDSALESAKSNDFSPAWQLAIEEIGAKGLLGRELQERIREIFARNQITPSVAHQEIQSLWTELQTLSTAADQLIASFEALHIGAEELSAGECELGILVPRAAVKNRLDELAAELKTLDRTFGVFAELATGSRPGFQIRSLSSSDLTVFLDLLPQVAACVAVAVERLVALYKQLLEIRDLRQKLEEQGLPAKALQGIDGHANGHMKKGIDALVDQLVDEWGTNIDTGRKNELRTELLDALNRVANRIDKGYSIEVRVEPPPAAKDEDEQAQKKREAIVIALEASQGIQFLRPTGAPILSLPEPADTGGREKKKEHG